MSTECFGMNSEIRSQKFVGRNRQSDGGDVVGVRWPPTSSEEGGQCSFSQLTGAANKTRNAVGTTPPAPSQPLSNVHIL